MQSVLALLINCLALAWAVLLAPLRLVRRRPSWLVVELSGDLPWRAAPRRWGFGGRRRPLVPASVEEVRSRLAAAETDPQVRGVVVKVEGVEAPGARLEALGLALRRFRDAGKQVVSYGRAVTTREYALMTSGSRLVLAPGGRLDLKGYCAELFVVGRALAKAGVKAHFLRRAEHKTAPELFTEAEVSPVQRETTRVLLEELLARAVGQVSEGRGRSDAEVRRWMDEGPFPAAEALARGLVDALADGEELEQELEKEGDGRARLRPLTAYRGPSVLSSPRYRPLRPPPRVGVVRVDGVIKLGQSVAVPWAVKAAGADSLLQALRQAREDESLRAIVLAIDSRGGSALASELVLRGVQRAARVKPVVAFFDRVAASGGYMIAVGAQAIVAAPTSLTGSIGVFGGKFEISGLLDRLEVGRVVLRAGQTAGLETPFEPWTASERAALDREIEQTYRSFLAIVAEGRRRTVEEVEPLAGGRVYTGRRALELGLVDAVGGFEEALERAAGLAGVRRPEPVFVDPPAGRFLRIPSLRAGLAEALGGLRPLEAERVFALDEQWLRVRPRP